MLTVPAGLAARPLAREGDAGAQWVAILPSLVDQLLAQWDLRVDGEALHGCTALVVPVRGADGQLQVLKVSWVDEETRDEALALTRWAGVGAVHVLQSAPEDGALLLEQLDADRSLQDVDEDDAVAAAASVLRRLHVEPPVGLRSAVALAERWQEELPREWRRLGRPGRRDLVERAAAACGELTGAPGPARLLHGDLHYGNVLVRLSPTPVQDLGGAPEWVAIDPQPLTGDGEHDLVLLLRNRWDDLVATGDAARACRRRLHALTESAQLAGERAQRWCLARAVDDALWFLDHHRTRDADVAWSVAGALR